MATNPNSTDSFVKDPFKAEEYSKWQKLEDAKNNEKAEIESNSSNEEEKQKELQEIEERYERRQRVFLYTYTVTKKASGGYSITIDTKYDNTKSWYEQKGKYANGMNTCILSIDTQQPPLSVKLALAGKEYYAPLSEVKGKNAFTAKGTDSGDSFTAHITINQVTSDGTLDVTIDSTPYTLSFEAEKMVEE